MEELEEYLGLFKEEDRNHQPELSADIPGTDTEQMIPGPVVVDN